MTVRRICVLSRLWEPGLGDLMQRNILLYALRRAHPSASLTLVLNATSVDRFSEFVDGHTYATDVLSCPDHDDDTPEAWEDLMSRLAAGAFDLCVVDPDSRGLGGSEAARCGIPERIGFATGYTGSTDLTTVIRIPRPVFGSPDLLDYVTSLRHALNLPAARTADLLPPPRYRSEPGPVPEGPVVALHPGGAPHWNRRWPQANFVELAVRLSDVVGSVLLVGGAAERGELGDLAACIRAIVPSLPVAVSAGDTFDRVATLIAGVSVLVGSDSAPAHLAASLQVPTVVLYGPTPTEFMWSRLYTRHHGINLRYACQQIRNLPRGPGSTTMPCAFRCPYPYLGSRGPYPRCLADIPVDRVLSAVRHRLPVDSSAIHPPRGQS